jgi:hypothetical protein
VSTINYKFLLVAHHLRKRLAIPALTHVQMTTFFTFTTNHLNIMFNISKNTPLVLEYKKCEYEPHIVIGSPQVLSPFALVLYIKVKSKSKNRGEFYRKNYLIQ